MATAEREISNLPKRNEKKNGINRRFATVGIAGILAISGIAASCDLFTKGGIILNGPTPTPSASGEIGLGSTPSPTFEISPNPSPSVEPTITPSPTPEKTPTPDINKVKVTGGFGETDPATDYPYYELSFKAITVVYEKVNNSKGTVLIGLTSAGSKVKVSIDSVIDLNNRILHLDKITGETVYVQFDKNSVLSDPNIGTIGQGAESMLPYIKVGSILRWVSIDLDKIPNGPPSWPDTSAQRSHNRTVLQELLNSNGKTISRTDQSLLFDGGSINVIEGNDIVNP